MKYFVILVSIKIFMILNHFLYKISLKYILQTKIYMVSSVSILMSIISPEVRAKDVSLCFTIYQFNTSSSSHLASTILVRYDMMYPTNIFICFVRFRLTPHVLGCNKLMLNTKYKLNSHNQQNHHLISYMFSLSISLLKENYLDVREDSFLHICGHTWQMYSLRHAFYIQGKYFALYSFFNASFMP